MEFAESCQSGHVLQIQVFRIMGVDVIQYIAELFRVLPLLGYADIGKQIVFLKVILPKFHKEIQQQRIYLQLRKFILAEIFIFYLHQCIMSGIVCLGIGIPGYVKRLQQQRLKTGKALQLCDHGHIKEENKAFPILRGCERMNLAHGDHEDFIGLDVVKSIVHICVIIILQRQDDFHGGMPMGAIAIILFVVPDADSGILMELDDFMCVSQFTVSGPVVVCLVIIKIIFSRCRYTHTHCAPTV